MISKKILFVQYSGNPSGSTISGRLAVKGFIENGWQVDAVFGFDGPYIREYIDLGCRVHVIEHRNWLRGKGIQSLRHVWNEVQVSRKFERLIQHLNPSVVYVNTLVSFAGIVAARRLKIPSVWHIRELFDDVEGEMKLPIIGGKKIVRWIIHHLASQVVVVSQNVAENVLGDIQNDNLHIVPNAVSAACFRRKMLSTESRECLGLRGANIVVGVPGGLRPVKGHEFFLKAAAPIAKQIPGCKFAISGSGAEEYRKYLESQVNRLGLSERVVFTGRLEDMYPFYSASDLICLPSKSESFGRTAIEAMAMGIPVIGTRVGGLQEIIDDGKNGLLVNYGDVPALAKAMDRLLRDSALRQRFGSEGRHKAEMEYSESIYQQRIIGIVDEMLVKAGLN